jgi:putative ABC transport system substrate-binding protein
VRRREFIGLIGGVAAAWPAGIRAQQTAKPPTIGFLGSTSASSMSQWFSVFVQRLRELGWIEGRTVAIEVRWAEGRSERYTEIVGEFIRLNVDLIFTSSTPPTIVAKQATEVIPIVSAVMGDPVGTGLVASLARPGGNVTGLSNQVTDLAGKRLALLREVVPGLRQLAMLANVSNPAVLVEIGELQASARTLSLEVIMLDIRRSEDIEHAFERLKGRAQALYVSGDPLVVANRAV